MVAATVQARLTRVARVVVTPVAAIRAAVPLVEVAIRVVPLPVVHPVVVAPLPAANHFALIMHHSSFIINR